MPLFGLEVVKVSDWAFKEIDGEVLWPLSGSEKEQDQAYDQEIHSLLNHILVGLETVTAVVEGWDQSHKYQLPSEVERHDVQELPHHCNLELQAFNQSTDIIVDYNGQLLLGQLFGLDNVSDYHNHQNQVKKV